MMPGAERQRRLDLDAELVGRHPRAVVAAVHDEAAGMDGDEVFEAGRDPVLGFDGVEGDVLVRCRRRRRGDQFADRGFIGRLGEMHADVPASVRAFESGDGGLVLVEALVEQIDDAPRGAFVADGESRTAGAWGDGEVIDGPKKEP